ncbi:MAG: DUF2892 domain-containing protein [Kiritimatiellae bacterium]|nr:DUF2892 domain-containing protein [Kiritimatiellia bacterium]
MRVEDGVRIMAGGVILLSAVLTHWVDGRWLWLAVFVGVNLIQSVFTGICPAASILKKAGLKEDGGCCGRTG